MAITPRGVLVKGPNCTDTSRYGLLTAVEPITNVDPHWMASGIEWEDFLCSPGITGFVDLCPSGIIPPSGVAPTDFVKPAERNNLFCQADPFILVGSYKCPPVGRPADQAFEIARQRLLKWEERQLEQTLWTGTVANGTGFVNPSFAFGNNQCGIVPIDLHPSGAVSLLQALSILETALGDTVGCGGIIHAPDGLAPYLQAQFQLEPLGDGYQTPSGTQIVLGHGYPGSGPANIAAVAGELWVFATGPLVMVRSNLFQTPDNIQEGFNRTINDVVVRAERFYAIGFSCALFAIRIALCNATCP